MKQAALRNCELVNQRGTRYRLFLGSYERPEEEPRLLHKDTLIYDKKLARIDRSVRARTASL